MQQLRLSCLAQIMIKLIRSPTISKMKSIIDICQGSWGLEKNYILLPCHEILSKVEYVSIYLGSDTDLEK